MFCKFCGNPIDRTTMKCGTCGKPVGMLSGGNGFKDLQGKASPPLSGNPGGSSKPSDPVSPVILNDPQIAQIAGDLREMKKKLSEKVVDKSAIIAGICVLLCLMNLLTVLALSGTNRKALRAIYSSIETYASQSTLRLDNLETLLAERQNSTADEQISPAKEEFTIEKNPQSETAVSPGITSIAFICKASGNNLQFSWMKYLANRNEWIMIEPSNVSFEVESSLNESMLTVVNASTEHEGTYICVITDGAGVVHYSSPAQLALNSNMSTNPDDPDSALADSLYNEN